MDEILRLFPSTLRQAVQKKIKGRWDELEEIRIRMHQPVELNFHHKVEWVAHPRPNEQDSEYVMNQLSEFSLYRLENELREGFVTIEGGHRVGLAGKVNTLNGAVKSIHHISFFNIRIAKAKEGAALALLPYIYHKDYLNTLFVGPPQSGKTTMIRDVIRWISTGWRTIPPQKVGVVDERSEIAASIRGVPQHNLGHRTDVLDACPKAEGMMMLIRSMSPNVIVVDEIGNKQDADALMEAIHAGVTVICTAHASSLTELKNRPSFQMLLDNHIFKRIIFLQREPFPGHVQSVYDEEENNIWKRVGMHV